MLEICRLSEVEGRVHLSALADVLVDCVAGGASVSFMAGLSKTDAVSFFENVLGAVARSERMLLAAFDESGLVGTVQVITAMPANQPHRADVSKLLVHRSARGKGIAIRLMERVEEAAREAGKTLLVLDTATGSAAEKLYLRLGWTQVGTIPGYSLLPDGAPCSTTIFWKEIKARQNGR